MKKNIENAKLVALAQYISSNFPESHFIVAIIPLDSEVNVGHVASFPKDVMAKVFTNLAKGLNNASENIVASIERDPR